jgi:uncharacterized SAM-binding protein YcdF (DUF218 family)
MLTLEKMMSVVLLPVPLCAAILLTGLFLLCCTRKQAAGKLAVFAGVAILLLLGNPAFSNILLRPLEHQYPRLVLPSDPETSRQVQAAKYIVVLGASEISDPQIRMSNQAREESLLRLVEAIRLYKQLGGRKLILAGGPGRDTYPMAEYMAVAAQGLGVRHQDMILEAKTEGGQEQVQLISMIVGKDPFILVTSASHMPKAMSMFKKAGGFPLAAPAGYWSTTHKNLGPADLCPTSDGLGKAERAINEYVELAWGTVKGDVKILASVRSKPAK